MKQGRKGWQIAAAVGILSLPAGKMMPDERK